MQWNLPNGQITPYAKKIEESQRMLAEVLDHPSMPKGGNVPTLGIIDSTSDNWDVSYDTSRTTDNETKMYYRRSIMCLVPLLPKASMGLWRQQFFQLQVRQ